MNHAWHFALHALPATPWKNGGGTTREIVCWPPGAGLDSFDWRISVATISSSGPFSAFAGIDRSITLLAGDGVLLHTPGAQHRLDTPLQPWAFAGETLVFAELLGSACEDFNVMTRRLTCCATVQVLREAAPALATTPGARASLLLAWGGAWRLQEPDACTLQHGEGVYVDGALPWQRATPLTAAPEARLLWVQVLPHTEVFVTKP